MAKEEANAGYYQGDSIDINVILSDLEGRTTNLRDKINLISKNFIFLKEESEKKLEKIRTENSLLKKEIENLKRTVTNITQEAEKWIRRDEIIIIERMLKDFQPLDFVRRKDLDEIIKKLIIENSLKWEH